MSDQPSEAAREAALTWLRSFFTIDEALIDQGHKDSLAQAFDDHAATLRTENAELTASLAAEKREHLATQELHERSMRMIEDAIGEYRDAFCGLLLTTNRARRPDE